MAATAPLGEGVIRRERRRRRRYNLTDEKRREIVSRVLDFYRRDLENRSEDRAIRLERYAKYRQWRGGATGWPWPGSSDQVIPDMMEASIRMQDTLHNAVMSARPIVVSRALQENDKQKQDAVDALHDTQFFMEQEGERVVEEAAESFCNDPCLTLYERYVTERRQNVERRNFDPIPLTLSPREHFMRLLQQEYPEHGLVQKDDEGWDWTLKAKSGDEQDDLEIRFYASEGKEVEMEVTGNPVVFDGPHVVVKRYDDVIHPPAVANLDIPGPSNPGGAPHVILREYPTRDELARLSRPSGDMPAFYDLVDDKDRKAWGVATRSHDDEETKEQTDAFAGEVDQDEAKDPIHGTLTRLVCFDVFDIDGDGETEDVVFWVLKETETLLRVRLLTEIHPGKKPERPLAEASFLPVGGRRAGISLLETMEGLHDFLKETVDQMVDNGTLVNLPWGTYRASSSLKPETLRPGPGDLIPTNDPNNDIHMQQFQGGNQAFWLNLVTMIRQQSERLTLQGDLQAGRVPGGASSALRTLGGIQTLLSQGEARPERILRRFFKAWRRVFRMMHRLNRYFLPDEKKFVVSGTILKEGENPYRQVARQEINVDMEFDFHANVLNSSKQALQQSLQMILGVAANPLALTLGISTPDTIYRLIRDLTQALGQEPNKYLHKPSPMADENPITAEEAVLSIMDGAFPDGAPAEASAAEHLQRITEITQMDEFGLFPPQNLPLLRAYIAQMTQRVRQESRQQAIAAAAQQGQGGGPQGGQRQAPLQQAGQAPLQQNELMDETLPSAGGGGAVA